MGESLPIRRAIEAVQFANVSLATDSQPDRFWLHSGAEADMFRPVRCPGIPPSPYAQVDRLILVRGTTQLGGWFDCSIWERNCSQIAHLNE